MRFLKKLLYYYKYKKIFNNNINNISIDNNIFIENRQLVNFGKGIYLGNNFYVMNRGVLAINDNVIFAPNVSIIDYNHDFKSEFFIPYSEDDIIKPVSIEKNVWIGLGVIILPGSYIEEGVIVSAGSVVKGRLEKNSIYSGNPTKKVASRVHNKNQKQYMFEKLGLK